MNTKLNHQVTDSMPNDHRSLGVRQNGLSLAVLILIGFGSPPVEASSAEFTIDPAQSYLALSATLLGMTITEQAPGSLTTTLSGLVNADMTSTTIRFTGASLVDASTNGIWQPSFGGGAGAASADFAAKAENPLFGTILAAVRNIALDLQSENLPLNGSAFDGSQVQFISPTNSTAAFDYSAGLLAGGRSLAGISTNKLANGATVTGNAGVQTLILPIDAQFPFTAFFTNDSVVSFTGKIVATRPLESIAPPSLVIQSITVGNSQLILRVKGAPETPFRLESSSDLQHWETCQDEVSVTDESYNISRNPSVRSQFYRIVR